MNGRRWFLGAIALTSMAALSVSDAQASPTRVLDVAVGATAARAGDATTGDALHAALVAAIEERPDLRLVDSRRADVVLRGSVTRLAAPNPEDGVSCEVQIVVADRQGNVRAMLNGRARARGRDADRLRRSVIRGAARGAIRPLGPTTRLR